MTTDNDPVLFEIGDNDRYVVMPMARDKTVGAKPAASTEPVSTEPEADTGIEVVGKESTTEEPMKKVESPRPDDDTDLQTRFFQLQMENDQLQAKVEH
jgi:hypothetical protein